jgi:hypothetical protein
MHIEESEAISLPQSVLLDGRHLPVWPLFSWLSVGRLVLVGAVGGWQHQPDRGEIVGVGLQFETRIGSNGKGQGGDIVDESCNPLFVSLHK